MVILPKTALGFALLFAERVRQAIFEASDAGIENARVKISPPDSAEDNTDSKVTASIGVCGVDSNFPELSIETLIEAGDRALHEAKVSGRNCVRVEPISDGNEALRIAV